MIRINVTMKDSENKAKKRLQKYQIIVIIRFIIIRNNR